MKLKSLIKIEKLNSEEKLFITGGRTAKSSNHTRGHDTCNNDSQRQDGGGDILQSKNY